jgi:outer membrane biosynthesis protein TonB
VATSARVADAATPELEPAPTVDDANDTTEATGDRPSPIAAALAESPPRVRKPTPPPLPQVDPLAAITSRPIGGGDLPQGDFAYPIKRSGGALLLKLLAGVAVAGLGFFAFIKLYPDDERPAQTAAVATPTAAPDVAAPVESAPPDPAAEEPATGSAAAPEAEAEVEPEIEMGAPDPDERHAPASTPPSRPAQRPGGSRSTSHATSHAASPTKPAEPKLPGDSTASAESTPPPSNDGSAAAPASDPGCDEVSCVLSKYDRPCCERFKPTETFTPKNVVPDALDRTMVRAGIEKIKPRIVACGEKHHGKGTVKVSVSVDGAGKVKSASVTETPDPALGECVQAAMKDATFGKSVNGGEFVYPFVF